MSVDTHAPLGLSLAATKNQRTTKRPRIPSLRVTHCGEAKKIREHELRHLKVVVEIPCTSGPRATPTSKPFDLLLLFERVGWKLK